MDCYRRGDFFAIVLLSGIKYGYQLQKIGLQHLICLPKISQNQFINKNVQNFQVRLVFVTNYMFPRM